MLCLTSKEFVEPVMASPESVSVSAGKWIERAEIDSVEMSQLRNKLLRKVGTRKE